MKWHVDIRVHSDVWSLVRKNCNIKTFQLTIWSIPIILINPSFTRAQRKWPVLIYKRNNTNYSGQKSNHPLEFSISKRIDWKHRLHQLLYFSFLIFYILYISYILWLLYFMTWSIRFRCQTILHHLLLVILPTVKKYLCPFYEQLLEPGSTQIALCSNSFEAWVHDIGTLGFLVSADLSYLNQR